MRVEIIRNSVPVNDQLEDVIKQKSGKVEERLKRYHPETADLEIRLQHDAKNNEFGCALNLKAFRDSLHTHKNHAELRVAVDKSFEALFKELEHYRAKINPTL